MPIIFRENSTKTVQQMNTLGWDFELRFEWKRMEFVEISLKKKWNQKWMQSELTPT